MTIQEALLSKKPFRRKHWSRWYERCGIDNRLIGFCRKSVSDGKAGDWIYIELDVEDILANDWITKESKSA